jgi:hypothetical protein
MEGLSSAWESDLQPESDMESAQDLSEEQEREQEWAANAVEAKRGATNAYRGSLFQQVDGSEGLCVYHESSPNKLLLAT